jgi:hypothetical protein
MVGINYDGHVFGVVDWINEVNALTLPSAGGELPYLKSTQQVL